MEKKKNSCPTIQYFFDINNEEIFLLFKNLWKVKKKPLINSFKSCWLQGKKIFLQKKKTKKKLRYPKQSYNDQDTSNKGKKIILP
jgi:hypothetical protein